MLYRIVIKNGTKRKEPLTGLGHGIPLGAVCGFYGTASDGWLLLDGRNTTGTSDELQTYYPALYAYLGNTNVLPDYRECALVGAGRNMTDIFEAPEIDPSTGVAGTQKHDVYAVGEFKDDQLANHTHPLPQASTGSYNGGYNTITQSCGNPNTPTSVNRGKRKGVNYYIKATPTLNEQNISAKAELKAIVAQSSDFADFVSRIANW